MMFVVSAPAGTGKTTLVQRLIQEFPSLMPSVSYTTRRPRQGELDGLHYHFITDAQFKEKITAGDFLEYVELYGTYYGTSRKWIEQQQQLGRHIVLVIDTQGALRIKKTCPAVLIFVSPPSLEVLRDRLIRRQTEEPEVIEKRLAVAAVEMKAVSYYDYQVVNDDLETAYDVFRSIFIAECHRIRVPASRG